MNFELHKFKKISENEKSAILQHPLGHKITIAKNVLSPEIKNQLSKLPMHLAKGTTDEPIPDSKQQGDETDALLEAEAQKLNGDKNLAANRPEEGKRSLAGYMPPEIAPAVETPPMPKPAEVAEPVKPGYEYFTNGTFDTNKFVIASPDAPLDAKIKALKALDAQDASKQAFDNADAKEKEQENQKKIEYNQLAAKRNLPQVEAQPAAPQVMPAAQMAQAPAAPSMPVQQQDPYGTQAYQSNFTQGLGNIEQGIQGQANAEAAAAEAKQPILDEAVKHQQDAIKNYQTHFDALEQERQNFQHDLMNQHIDPNRYLHSMGGGQKIATAIGLILGGLGGSNGARQVNDFLDKQIDRDIAAQGKDLGKTENLLSANMKQFGNLKDATDMTKVMYNEMINHQLDAAANKSQSQVVQNRAKQMIGQKQMENAQTLSQIAMRQNLGGGNQDPATKLRVLGLAGIIPKEQVEPNFKSLQGAQNMMRQRDNLIAAFETVDDNNTVFNRIAHLGFTPAKTLAARDPLLAQLVKDSEGRITPTDIDLMKPLFPVPGDQPSTVAFKKQQLIKFIDEKMHYPELESLGVNPKAGARFNTQGQKSFQLGAPVK